MRIECDVATSAPPESVWPRVADFAHAASWDPGVAWVRRLQPERPLGVGVRYIVGVRAGLLVVPMAYRIVAWLPPSRVVLEGRGGAFEARDDIEVVADGSASRVVWRADLGLRGPLGLFTPMMAPVFARVADHAMAGLRRWLSG